MKETDEIIRRLKESFDGEPWYGTSITGVLEGIPSGIVMAKCEPSQNSIARLVKHMLNWREFVIRKLEGDRDFDIDLNSEADWTDVRIGNRGDWAELCRQLTESQEKIIALLSEMGEVSLSGMVPGKQYDFRFLIEGLIQHDIYHLGQIVLIHRLVKQL